MEEKKNIFKEILIRKPSIIFYFICIIIGGGIGLAVGFDTFIEGPVIISDAEFIAYLPMLDNPYLNAIFTIPLYSLIITIIITILIYIHLILWSLAFKAAFKDKFNYSISDLKIFKGILCFTFLSLHFFIVFGLVIKLIEVWNNQTFILILLYLIPILGVFIFYIYLNFNFLKTMLK